MHYADGTCGLFGRATPERHDIGVDMTAYDLSRRRRRPLHPGLVAIGATLLIAAFATDCAYWKTLLFQWNNMSSWLLAAGLIAAGFAVVALNLFRHGASIDHASRFRTLANASAKLFRLGEGHEGRRGKAAFHHRAIE